MKNVPTRATGEAMLSLTRRLFLRSSAAATLGGMAMMATPSTAATAVEPDRLQPLFDAHAKAYAAFTAAIDLHEESDDEASAYAFHVASDGERVALWDICAFLCQTPGEHVRKGEFLVREVRFSQLDAAFVDCILAAMSGKALSFEDYYDLTPTA